MIRELELQQYERVRSLFQGLDYQLMAAAVIDSTSPGKIWVDDLDTPTTARCSCETHLHGGSNGSCETPIRRGTFYSSRDSIRCRFGRAKLLPSGKRSMWLPRDSPPPTPPRSPAVGQATGRGVKCRPPSRAPLCVVLPHAMLVTYRRIGKTRAPLCVVLPHAMLVTYSSDRQNYVEGLGEAPKQRDRVPRATPPLQRG